VLVTIIPNMTGAVGATQRWMSRRVYDLHVPIDRERLARSFDGRAGEQLYIDYFVSSNFWTVNPGKAEDGRRGIAKRLGYRLLTLSSVAVWLVERMLRIRLPATRVLAPYVVSIWRVAPRAAVVSE
jgi:hypothetical protein